MASIFTESHNPATMTTLFDCVIAGCDARMTVADEAVNSGTRQQAASTFVSHLRMLHGLVPVEYADAEYHRGYRDGQEHVASQRGESPVEAPPVPDPAYLWNRLLDRI